MNRPLAIASKPPTTCALRTALRWNAIDGLLLLVAAVWGGSYTAAKVATQQLPVLEFLVLRFGLTFILLLPTLRHVAGPKWRTALGGAALLGINLLVIFICETFGVSLTTASNAAFLISLCVAVTPVCEWWLLGRRPTRMTLLAAGLSLTGASLLAFQHGGDTQLAWGDALMVGAAILRGIMVCMTRRYALSHTIPALTLTAIQMGVMTAGAGIVLVVAQGWHFHPIPTTAEFWAATAFLVLLCTLFAFFVQNYAASRASPSRVALLMGSEPLFGALIAGLWLGESMTVLGWFGGSLMLVTAWWVTRTRADERAT